MALTTRQKPNIHHRKLRGAHHRHDKNYLKAYHPYLPLLLVVVVGLAINVFWASRAHVLGASTTLTATQLLQTTNQERSQQHVNSLHINNKLSAAAQSKAIDMAQDDYWSHNAPDGKTPWSFISQSGYQYSAAAENLAYGFSNSESTITGWMNSPEHRANLLNGTYEEVGFGITTTKDYLGKGPTTIIVAMYAEPAATSEATALASAYTDLGDTTSGPIRTVSRVQLLTGGQAPWSFALISALTLFGAVFLVIRHSLAWRRVIVSSEAFILEHKLLDVIVISMSVAGYVLTRAAGYIQ